MSTKHTHKALGTNAFEVLHVAFRASASDTRIAGARIRLCFTKATFVKWRTFATKSADQIFTRAALAWIRITFRHRKLTLVSTVTNVTDAMIVGVIIDARAKDTGVRGAGRDLEPAMRSMESLWAYTFITVVSSL